ncbi:MAG: ribonuclease [Clostridia bacterium]|nr:ribonuclease [Clostridia bacterium]
MVALSLFTFSGCDMDTETALSLTEAVLSAVLEEDESPYSHTGSDSDPLPFEPDDNYYETLVQEDGWYDDVETVAAYLIAYEELPDNYLTKKEAEALGWVSKEGNLWDVAEGMSIGGDYFGNYEGLLPEGKYRECDIDYDGGYRGEERLIYTTQGDLYIYYTDDHYESFELIYAEGE